jgi:[ribosomal protein S18]-alanine N-acetyltransferase
MHADQALEVIRPATPVDIDAIVTIERVAFSDPPWSRRSFVSLLRDPHVQFLVAAVADPLPHAGRELHSAPDVPEVAGYVVTWVVADEADVSNLAVSPGRQRRGIGRRLLEAAITGVQAVGARTVYLEVRESNVAALRLYDSRGFVVIGRRARYYRSPSEDALVLRLNLPDDGPGAAAHGDGDALE